MQVINCCERQLLIDSAQRSILVYINAICANPSVSLWPLLLNEQTIIIFRARNVTNKTNIPPQSINIYNRQH